MTYFDVLTALGPLARKLQLRDSQYEDHLMALHRRLAGLAAEIQRSILVDLRTMWPGSLDLDEGSA